MEINKHIRTMKFPIRYIDRGKSPGKPRNEEKTPSGGKDEVSIGDGDTAPSQEMPPVKPQDIPGQSEQDATAPPSRNWTVLVYEAADNDLEKFMVQDVNDMESIGSNTDLNIVVQMDRGKEPSELSGGWGGVRRLKLTKNDDPYNIDSPVLQDLGQINMSAPENLSDFIQWGMKNFPANHYMLVMSDHGAGWKGGIEDKSHDDWMSMPRMRKGIEDAQKKTGKKLDVIGFDACLMGQTEVAYELKDVADYMVASQEKEGAGGWPYHNILSKDILENIENAIKLKIKLEPDEMAKFIVHAAAKDQKNLPTMSAIDLSKMKSVGEATDKFAKAIIKTDTPGSLLKTLIRKTQNFEGFKDHYDFCKKIVMDDRVKDKNLKDSAQEVMDRIYEAVILEEHSEDYPGAQGLSVYLPSYRPSPPDDYLETRFARDTNWDEALTFIENGPSQVSNQKPEKIDE
ncbi:MAG: hypothetical protein K8T10_04210 [Candidatus Eremiobacteraeota bacterium]|nr:hypothetical protein [Candidatus Eremiobacteraeota bacterium]